MKCVSDKTRWANGLTLLEMIIAIAIMAVVFSALLPQFRNISNSWASKQGNAEALQNGRVLVDYLNRNLAKAVKVTAVSASSETDGYIEFEDIDTTTWRFDIAANNYIEFGQVGSLFDLAGPVSSLSFTCYVLDDDGLKDWDTETMDVDSIRFVKIEATMVNSSPNGQDKTFTTSTFIRTNASASGSGEIYTEPDSEFEYNGALGEHPDLCQIDSTHYLCAYTGPGWGGWAVVLTVDTDDWTVSKGTQFEFDTDTGVYPALCQIDSTHYLCVYAGSSSANAVVLTVNTGNWTITKATPVPFGDGDVHPALAKIDDAHYLCVYEGDQNKGLAVVLTVDLNNWTIDDKEPLEFDSQRGIESALVKIDSAHYLCAYIGAQDDGLAVVLTVDLNNWTIDDETPFKISQKRGEPALVEIDSTHYLYVCQSDGGAGWAVVLTVNTSSWDITRSTSLGFAGELREPSLADINGEQFLCAYRGDNNDGFASVLTVDDSDWSITSGAPYLFDVTAYFINLISIDESHFLCVYQSASLSGDGLILNIPGGILP